MLENMKTIEKEMEEFSALLTATEPSVETNEEVNEPEGPSAEVQEESGDLSFGGEVESTIKDGKLFCPNPNGLFPHPFVSKLLP